MSVPVAANREAAIAAGTIDPYAQEPESEEDTIEPPDEEHDHLPFWRDDDDGPDPDPHPSMCATRARSVHRPTAPASCVPPAPPPADARAPLPSPGRHVPSSGAVDTLVGTV